VVVDKSPYHSKPRLPAKKWRKLVLSPIMRAGDCNGDIPTQRTGLLTSLERRTATSLLDFGKMGMGQTLKNGG